MSSTRISPIGFCRCFVAGPSIGLGNRTPVQRLEGNDIARVLHRVVNQGQGVFEPQPKPMRYGLNWRLAGETVVFQRGHMQVGRRVVGLFSLALPPQSSAANALGELYSLPYDISVVLEWRGVDRFDSSKRIHGVKKHYNNLRWSLWAAVQETEGSQMALEDASSGAAVEQLHRASLELESLGVVFGELAMSFSVAVDSRKELDEIGAHVQRVLLHLDGKAVHETYGQPSVWFGPWPGQPPSILPRPIFASSGVPANPSP